MSSDKVPFSAMGHICNQYLKTNKSSSEETSKIQRYKTIPVTAGSLLTMREPSRFVLVAVTLVHSFRRRGYLLRTMAGPEKYNISSSFDHVNSFMPFNFVKVFLT